MDPLTLLSLVVIAALFVRAALLVRREIAALRAEHAAAVGRLEDADGLVLKAIDSAYVQHTAVLAEERTKREQDRERLGLRVDAVAREAKTDALGLRERLDRHQHENDVDAEALIRRVSLLEDTDRTHDHLGYGLTHVHAFEGREREDGAIVARCTVNGCGGKFTLVVGG